MIVIYPFLRCVNIQFRKWGQKLGSLDFFRYFRVYGGCAFTCYHILHVGTIVSAVVVIGVAVVILNGIIKPMLCICSY